MLYLLVFGDHEALVADTPTSQNGGSASTESPLLSRTDPRNHPGRLPLGVPECCTCWYLVIMKLLWQTHQRHRMVVLPQQNHHFCVSNGPAQSPWTLPP